MDIQQFCAAVQCTRMVADVWHDAFEAAMREFAITTPSRQAAFLAQVGHESLSLSRIAEGLNYSAQRLMAVWPKRFPTLESTHYYEHQPEHLANFVYANRMGNGPFESGDGFRFAGKGPLQITGRANYEELGDALDLPLADHPEMLLEPAVGARAAAWFWAVHGCNELADAGDFDAISDVINLGHRTERDGDAEGYADRLSRYDAAQKALA
jgi:putative chitinase